MANLRPPVVAGKFYPLHETDLKATVSGLLGAQESRTRRPALGVIVPHAGYVYSGTCTARTLAEVSIPARVIMLGPNHTGRGRAFSAAPHDLWRTPLGNAPIDHELLDALAAACPRIAREPDAHRGEHSLEVEVPFLQVLRPDVRIAPLLVGTHDLAALEEVGAALALVLSRLPEPALVLVSSDMSHYEPADQARAKDEIALARIAALDPRGLHRDVTTHGISMCGMAPAVVALTALIARGATSAEVVAYTHSGEVTGDDREVVAYAGVVIR